MKKDKEDCRKQAQALRQAGYSFGQIAKELNIPCMRSRSARSVISSLQTRA